MGLSVWAYGILMTDEYPPVPAGRRRRRSDDHPGLAGSARKSPLNTCGHPGIALRR